MVYRRVEKEVRAESLGEKGGNGIPDTEDLRITFHNVDANSAFRETLFNICEVAETYKLNSEKFVLSVMETNLKVLVI